MSPEWTVGFARLRLDAEVWQSLLDATDLQDACDLVTCDDEPNSIDRFALRSSDEVALTAVRREIPAGFSAADGHRLSDHDPTALTVSWQAVE